MGMGIPECQFVPCGCTQGPGGLRGKCQLPESRIKVAMSCHARVGTGTHAFCGNSERF